MGLRGKDYAVFNEEKPEVPVVNFSFCPQPTCLFDPIYARLDFFPELTDVELKQHFVAGLRRDIGVKQWA
ncbi:hypothetical protein ALP27_00845 [Pseudomonas savastanoi pv. glycinea]|nr:hypothetical protein ALP27_00845 [Pseudomonas savastanoi pv. glycinea]RMW32507.1 hypothetical protein ALO96_02750 [Pseudomonas savastanoi pv. glycinea]